MDLDALFDIIEGLRSMCKSTYLDKPIYIYDISCRLSRNEPADSIVVAAMAVDEDICRLYEKSYPVEWARYLVIAQNAIEQYNKLKHETY